MSTIASVEQSCTACGRTEVGALLRQHRERLGWSQERLARVAGVDLSNLNRIEGGRRGGSARTIALLCRGLGLAPAESTVVLMAAGHIPAGLDADRLRAALTLVQVASVAEVEAAYRLIVAARQEMRI